MSSVNDALFGRIGLAVTLYLASLARARAGLGPLGDDRLRGIPLWEIGIPVIVWAAVR